MYANQGVPTLVQRALEADDNKLERVRRLRAYIVRNLGHVRIVQRRVHLVEDEERARPVADSRRKSAQMRPRMRSTHLPVWMAKIEGPAPQPSFRRRTAAPCLGSASWGGRRDIRYCLHMVPEEHPGKIKGEMRADAWRGF
jgi:hypothetical protein